MDQHPYQPGRPLSEFELTEGCTKDVWGEFRYGHCSVIDRIARLAMHWCATWPCISLCQPPSALGRIHARPCKARLGDAHTPPKRLLSSRLIGPNRRSSRGPLFRETEPKFFSSISIVQPMSDGISLLSRLSPSFPSTPPSSGLPPIRTRSTVHPFLPFGLSLSHSDSGDRQ